MSMDYLSKYEGKTLVLYWKSEYEQRVRIDGGSAGLSHAIDSILRSSGVASGIPGIIPESVEFRIEE